MIRERSSSKEVQYKPSHRSRGEKGESMLSPPDGLDVKKAELI